MSKYRSVDVGNTLFGKVKLDPSCIACDRPFGLAAQVRERDPLRSRWVGVPLGQYTVLSAPRV